MTGDRERASHTGCLRHSLDGADFPALHIQFQQVDAGEFRAFGHMVEGEVQGLNIAERVQFAEQAQAAECDGMRFDSNDAHVENDIDEYDVRYAMHPHAVLKVYADAGRPSLGPAGYHDAQESAASGSVEGAIQCASKCHGMIGGDARPLIIYSTIDCNLVRRPSVTIILNSGAHQRTLPGALLREGLLRAAVRTATDLDILEPGPDGNLKLVHRFPTYRIANRILWAIWRRVPPCWQKFVPLLGWSTVSDHWISGRLPASDVFHSPMGVYLGSLHRAKARGAVTLIDTPTMHPLAFQREMLSDCADAGVNAFDGEHIMSPAIISRCQRQYEMCDRIIVYSSAAQRSFDPFFYASKTVVVMPGVDHRLFCPSAGARPSGSFRVCYVGRIEAPKGIHHLLGAWKQLSLPDAELTLVGRVLPEMAYLETEGGAAGIKLAGILLAEGVARCCQESDLFVFPSVNEGLSLALLEGMSCGLPVVACRDTGAADCVTPGKEGLLVPGRDTGALAEAILWCYRHRDELAAMGRAARMRVEAEFTLADYQRRLMELYESVIS